MLEDEFGSLAALQVERRLRDREVGKLLRHGSGERSMIT
jgi:hypothetical protein